MKEDKKAKLFKEFLSQNEVLIVDKSSASRRRLTKTLVDLGSKRHLIHSVAHYSEAIEVIDDRQPKLILSDYLVNGGSGFDLFKAYREKYPDEKKATLILITSNISQSAVAKAAEEDVDTFIIKPYTVQSLEQSLTNGVIGKLYPSLYIQKIEEGKEKLFAGKYEEALEVFEVAMQLHKQPSLAHFYHGQTKYFMENLEEATTDYKKGLEINNIHYKCQIGLYELFMKEDKAFEAYEVVKNIAKYFPANPDRLKEVVRLAIKTKNYDDMDSYYNIFVELDERPDDVVNYVCSGMFIYGKHAFLNNEKPKGKEVFEKVAISCAGMTKFLRAMVVELTTWEIFDDAQKLLSRFPSGTYDDYDYMVASYLAESNNMTNNQKMTSGLEIYNAGHKDFNVFKIMIDALKAEGFEDKAEDYLIEAQKLWPDKYNSNAA